MTGYRDRAPGYLTFRVAPQEGPIAAFAEQEAWQARELYPDLMGVGLAEFFHAREHEAGGWELSEYGTDTPQGARDSLGSHFRLRSSAAGEAGEKKAQKTWMAAALRMDREVVDEIRVLGERFRIVRAAKFIRMGNGGPEPPRPSDPDPDPAETGANHRTRSRTKGFVVDPYISTGLSDSLLKLDLVRFIGTSPGAGPEVREDALRAAVEYPGGVLLPPVFMISERTDGRWTPHNPGSADVTPQEARDGLASWLRVMAPFTMDLPDGKRAEYARAADVLDEKRCNTLSVDGYRFRVTRVERLVRVGPDGPEGPRPSDFDPEPPVEVHVRLLKEQGLWKEEDEPLELDERALQFQALWEQEVKRREAVEERRASRKRT